MMGQIVRFAIEPKMLADIAKFHGTGEVIGIISTLTTTAKAQRDLEMGLFNGVCKRANVTETEKKQMDDMFVSYEQMKYTQNVLIDTIAELVKGFSKGRK